MSLMAQAGDVSPRNIEAAVPARFRNPDRYMRYQGPQNGSGRPATPTLTKLLIELACGRCRFRSFRVDRLE